MWTFIRASLPVAIVALVTIEASPAWAVFHITEVALPAPAAGGLIGAAIIGAIVAARLWRRK